VAREIAAALAVAFAGWLIGESVDELRMIPKLIVMFGVPILVAVAIWLLFRRFALAAALGALTALAVFGGVRCYARAFNSCVAQTEHIRDTIEWNRRAHGGYPPTLRDAFLNPPCQRCIRGTIIRYSATHEHYVVSFSDALMTWETTDRTAWKVSK
jgi:hypothetical protein